MNKNGFSLLEIAVVLVILGILTALLAPQLLEMLNNARMRHATSQAMDLKKIVIEYQLDPLMKRNTRDRGRFTKNNPASVEITIMDLVNDGYLRSRPFNPWKEPWSLEVTNIGSSVVEAYLSTKDGRGNSLKYYVGKE